MAAAAKDDEHPFNRVINDPRFKGILAKYDLKACTTTTPEKVCGLQFSYTIDRGNTITVGFAHTATHMANMNDATFCVNMANFCFIVERLGIAVANARVECEESEFFGIRDLGNILVVMSHIFCVSRGRQDEAVAALAAVELNSDARVAV